MRFKTIAFALIVSSAVFILGCDDDDSSTVVEEQLSFEVTVTPPLDSAWLYLQAINNNGFSSQLFSGSPCADFSSTSSGLMTEKLTVSRGQIIHIKVGLSSLLSVAYCSDVQVEASLNGIPFDVRTFRMGGNTWLHTCPQGTEQQYEIAIP